MFYLRNETRDKTLRLAGEYQLHCFTKLSGGNNMTPTKTQTQGWLPSIFNDFFGNEWITKNRSAVPAVNIMENENAYHVEVAVPGLKKEDINMRIDENGHMIITVDTQKEKEDEAQKGKYIRREFSCTQFRQTLLLPENIDEAKIEAKYESGLLAIAIPKKKTAENTEPKKIAIK